MAQTAVHAPATRQRAGASAHTVRHEVVPEAPSSNSSSEDDQPRRGHAGRTNGAAATAGDPKNGAPKSQRRTEQNRSAQRAFRERRLQYVKTLEDQLTQASQSLADAERIKQENSELQRLIRNLQRENALLRTVVGGADVAPLDNLSPSPLDSDDADSSNADGDQSPERVPQGTAEPAFSFGADDDDDVYDLMKIKGELGEGTLAYQTILANLGADGRLRRSFPPKADLPVNGPAAEDPEDGNDLAYGRLADDVLGSHAAEPFYDPNNVLPEPDVAGLTASAVARRLVSDGFGGSALPPLFPLITPPLSDTSTPGYSGGYGLSLDTPEHELGSVDDSAAVAEVPSLRTLSSSSANGDTVGLTPPRDELPPTGGVATSHPTKRALAEADVYATDQPACLNRPLTRDEHFDRDPVEEELCEIMRAKALLGAVDPSAYNKSKFVKKTTAT